MTITVPFESGAGQRLDLFLVRAAPGFSRAALQRMIRAGHITLNGNPVKAKTALREGDVIVLTEPEPKPAKAPSQDIPLDILYEDKVLVVLEGK